MAGWAATPGFGMAVSEIWAKNNLFAGTGE